jgi:hypothetical protein
MGFQMNSDQIAGLLDNNPGSSVGYRKNPILGFDAIVTDIILEPVRHFLRQEGNLRLFSTFWIPNDSLPVFDILGCEFENLADPHARTGHEFEHKTIPGIGRSEDDLIDYVFFNNFKLGWFPCPEKLPERGIITGILEIGINRIFDEIEKGGQEGKS